MTDAPAPAPILHPPVAAEATLLGSLLLGYTPLCAAAALQPEFFSAPLNADIFRAIRARLSSFPDESEHDRISAVIKAVPRAHGDVIVALLQLGRFHDVAALIVPRIIDTWARRELRLIGKTIKREARETRLTGAELLALAEQRLADLRAALGPREVGS